jgi:hypothetical protein
MKRSGWELMADGVANGVRFVQQRDWGRKEKNGDNQGGNSEQQAAIFMERLGSRHGGVDQRNHKAGVDFQTG